MTYRLPLEGIRVVEITCVWAGPFAGQLLADWGAEVIRVESRQHWQINTRGRRARPSKEEIAPDVCLPWSGGYPNRDPGKRPWNRFVWFNAFNRNKLGMTVDLTKPEGLQIFQRLIAKSDIFIENNSPGTMEKLGITYEVLKKFKSDLIMIRMPPFGLNGPYKDYRTLGSHLGMISGHFSIQGYPDMDSTQGYDIFHADAAAGASAALAALVALYYRDITGKGQLIEVAQFEAFIHQLAEPLLDYILTGRVRDRVGNRYSTAVPCGCFRCQGEDRWVNITVTTDEEWEALCRVLGNPSWTRGERFSTPVNRCNNQDILEELLEEWTIKHDNYEIMHMLQKGGVPAGVVMNARDCFSDPHLKKRKFFNRLTQLDCGTHLYPGLAWKQSKTPNKLRLPPVRLGEHNEYVYKQIIGVTNEEYERLTRGGHIGMDFIESIP